MFIVQEIFSLFVNLLVDFLLKYIEIQLFKTVSQM